MVEQVTDGYNRAKRKPGGWTGHAMPMNKLRKRTPNMHVYVGG